MENFRKELAQKRAQPGTRTQRFGRRITIKVRGRRSRGRRRSR